MFSRNPMLISGAFFLIPRVIFLRIVARKDYDHEHIFAQLLAMDPFFPNFNLVAGVFAELTTCFDPNLHDTRRTKFLG